jgi:glycosyltransferase involved in cell wall biosynthesis
MDQKLISVVIPCYNEVENIVPLSRMITSIFRERLSRYAYEIIVSDNKSTDGTRELLHELCASDARIKVLYNDRTYLQGFSLNNAIMHASGDAMIILYADFQDPPELIPQLIEQWEAGKKVVPLVRVASKEGAVMYQARRLFYFLLRITSGLRIIANYTGTGCYDKEFVDRCKANMSHLFAMRFFVAKHGYDIGRVEFVQPARKGGRSSNNLAGLFQNASELVAQNYSRRLPFYILGVSLVGGAASIVGGVFVLARKLLYWNEVSAGIAPLMLMLLACLFLQSFLYAQTWVYVNRLEARAVPDTPSVELGEASALDWSVKQARRISGAVERSSVFVPIIGYAGTGLTVLASLVYFVYKLIHWDNFSIGIVPSLLIVCLIAALQLAIGGVLIQNLQRNLWMLSMKEEPLVRVEKRENLGATERPPPKA